MTPPPHPAPTAAPQTDPARQAGPPPARPRPNVLWIMADQHHAGCMSCAGHPNVLTPSLDRIAARGVRFTNGFANNPICSPSRICFITGQYMHTHQMFGNYHSEWPEPNPDTLACLFRRHGYQTALTGKSHMTRRWDHDGFEFIRYTDLTDGLHDDPATCHYYQYLLDHGLADSYEEGGGFAGHHGRDGTQPALLPLEHSIERFTGDTTLQFLRQRDRRRPFFVQMSFQRPHEPITPAREFFDMYDPDRMVLPDSAADYFERRFAGKPQFQQAYVQRGGVYPWANPDPRTLQRLLASYYALISQIDAEIGRVLDHLAQAGDLDNTIVFYHADHGDFAGDHGLFHKNFGIYECIHRIPWLLSWPGGPRGTACDGLVESVDWYTTLCALCDVPAPPGREGADIAPVALGQAPGKDAVFCEWDSLNQFQGKVAAIRTPRHRLVFYDDHAGGELYDHHADPGEIDNLWNQPAHAQTQRRLIERLFAFVLRYQPRTDKARDKTLSQRHRFSARDLLHKHGKYWSQLQSVYGARNTWPPPTTGQ